MIADLPRGQPCEHGDCAVVGVKPALGVQRFPRTDILRLCDAPSIFARMPHRRLVKRAWNRSRNIDYHQPNGAPDSGVCPMSGAEHAHARIQRKLVRDWAVHHRKHGGAHSADRDGVQVELRFAHRLNRRKCRREILRQASRHHRIDRNLFDGNNPPLCRLRTQNLRRRPSRIVQERLHLLDGGRHNR